MLACGGCGDPPGDAAGGGRSAALTLHRGNGGDPLSLDPAEAQDEHAFAVLADLYEGLLVAGPNGELVPGAARDYSVSDDGLTYRFRLRRDGRWSDGRPVTAADFVAGIRRALRPATTSGYAFLLEAVRGAPDVIRGRAAPDSLGLRAIDDLTLEIVLARPTPALPAILSLPIAFPFPAGDSATPGRFSEPAQFVGNGAYRLARWRVGSRIRLVRNTRFRALHDVAIGAVEYYAITDAQAELNMYRAGELDITATVPGGALSSLSATRPDELHIAPRLALYYFAFDLSEAPLDDPRLRQALSMALDRDAIVALLGRGERPAYGLVPPGIGSYEPARYAWQALASGDRQAAARRLYKQAGYGADRPLELTLVYDTGSVHETVALAARSMWADVLGAEVLLERREWQYFLDTRDQRGEWDVMRFAWTGDYPHAQTFLAILAADSPQNLPGYVNADYDRRLLAAAMAGQPADQQRLLREAERVAIDDYPIAPVYFYVSKHLVAPSVDGFRANALDRNPTRYLRKHR